MAEAWKEHNELIDLFDESRDYTFREIEGMIRDVAESFEHIRVFGVYRMPANEVGTTVGHLFHMERGIPSWRERDLKHTFLFLNLMKVWSIKLVRRMEAMQLILALFLLIGAIGMLETFLQLIGDY